MLIFALLIGIYSYIIFFLGINSFLYPRIVFLTTFFFWLIVIAWKKDEIITLLKKFLRDSKQVAKRKDYLLFFLSLFILQLVVNIIGALAPELAFDALWYHLTLPKLFLLHHSIYYISGGLLYYSVMPKLGEMLSIAALSFGNETFVKLIHLSFGLFTCLGIYKLGRAFYPGKIAFLAVIIFYSNIVVAWESTVAYIDLIRAFFEILALTSFIKWYITDSKRWLIYSSVMLGLAITTKVLALGSLLIFVLLIIYSVYEKHAGKIVGGLSIIVMYISVALLIPLPWFLFAFINTGNPVFPFFSKTYQLTPEPLSFFGFFKDIWNIFLYSPDPISPIYMIFLPLIIIFFPKFTREIKMIALYVFLAIIVWYFTPRTGGGRFLLPYLPAFSILCVAVCNHLRTKQTLLFRFLIGIIILSSLITIGYRFVASIKYLPVIVGKESKREFLSNHLNFTFGDFYDTDGYFSQNISSTDNVLLYGFHNLYYVDFPFVHASWAREGDEFTHIAVQGVELPPKYRDWQLIYENAKTTVKVFAPPREECNPVCVY